MTATATPTLERIARVRRPLGALLAPLVLAWAWLVVAAPIDRTQGVIQKILYVHPPLAYGAYLGFVLTAIGGALYLWKQRAIYDQLAVAGAEVGVVVCTLMMVTGPIWAKGTWGHWWTWDPRLTLTLLLWFVYLARSEEHTSELQSPCNLVCRLLLEKKNKKSMHILFFTQENENPTNNIK